MKDPIITWPAITLAIMVVVMLWIGVRRYRMDLELRGTKVILFLGFCVLAPISLLFTVQVNTEQAKNPEFCGSCHLMKPKLADIRNPDSENLAAIHTQRGFIQHEQCYTCHSDYHMFGTAKTKARGMRHLYADLFKKENGPVKLYTPFPNANCLQCHNGKVRFESNPMHSDILCELRTNDISCTECHDNIHPQQEGE